MSRPKNSSPQRGVLECSCMQMIKYNFLSLALHLQKMRKGTQFSLEYWMLEINSRTFNSMFNHRSVQLYSFYYANSAKSPLVNNSTQSVFSENFFSKSIFQKTNHTSNTQLSAIKTKNTF